MKQPTDTKTMELPMPGAKRGRGRPPTGVAMTSAERQKAYRDRVRENGPAGPAGKSFYQIEAQLAAARKRIERLEAENALLIEERAKAFAAAEEARAALADNGEKNLLSVAKAKIAEMETQIDRMMEHSEWSHKQLEAFQLKIKNMEAAAKRKASRKTTAVTESN